MMSFTWPQVLEARISTSTFSSVPAPYRWKGGNTPHTSHFMFHVSHVLAVAPTVPWWHCGVKSRHKRQVGSSDPRSGSRICLRALPSGRWSDPVVQIQNVLDWVVVQHQCVTALWRCAAKDFSGCCMWLNNKMNTFHISTQPHEHIVLTRCVTHWPVNSPDHETTPCHHQG